MGSSKKVYLGPCKGFRIRGLKGNYGGYIQGYGGGLQGRICRVEAETAGPEEFKVSSSEGFTRPLNHRHTRVPPHGKWSAGKTGAAQNPFGVSGDVVSVT